METSVNSRKPARFYIGILIFSALILLPVGFVGTDILRSFYGIGASPQSVSCLPWTWFIERPIPPHSLYLGELVIARTPKAFHDYRLGKMVIGLPGDRILENSKGLWINGHFWGKLWLRGWLKKEKHKSLLHLPYSKVIPKNHYLLLGTNPMSLDGRYWGLVTKKQIYGQIVAPL